MSTSTFPPEELKAIVQEVATLLQQRNETISVAETVYHSLTT
jgi:nicotinamide mononucleotide (NMN) deamidase PncC